MFEIKKQLNYKNFADVLRQKTGCEVKIDVVSGSHHYHYELSKDGIVLGVLCYDKGDVSFAPFVRADDKEAMRSDKVFINARYFPSFDDFVGVMKVFQEIFVVDFDEVLS